MLTNINIANSNIMNTSIPTLNMARSEPPVSDTMNMARSEPPVSDTITLWMSPNGSYPVVPRLLLTNDGFQTLTNVNEHIFCRRSIMWIVKRSQGDFAGAKKMEHRNCHLRDYNQRDFGMGLCGASIAGVACRYGAECNFIHTLNYPQIIQARAPVIQEPVVQEPVVQEPVIQEPVIQEPRVPRIPRAPRIPREKKLMCMNIMKQKYSRLVDEVPCDGNCGFAHSSEEQFVPPVVNDLKNMIEMNEFYIYLPQIIEKIQNVLRNTSEEIADKIFSINQSRTFPHNTHVSAWLTWWKKSVESIRKEQLYRNTNILNPFDNVKDENILWEICRRMTICNSSKAMAKRILAGRWTEPVNICHGGKSCKFGVHIENIDENGSLFVIDIKHLNGGPPTFNKNIVANRAVQLSELERLKVNRQNRYNETLTCHGNQRVALDASLLTMKQSVDTACEKYLNMYNPIQLFKDPTPTSVTPVSNNNTSTIRSKSIPKPPMSPDEQKEKFFRTFTLSDMSLNTNEAWSRFCSKENNISNDVDIFYKRVCKAYRYWTESEIVTNKIIETPKTGNRVKTKKGWVLDGEQCTEIEEIKECSEKALYHDFWAFLFNIPIVPDQSNIKKIIKPIAIVDDNGWRTPTPKLIENETILSLAHLSPEMLKETEIVKNIIKIRLWTVEESIKCDELPTEFILNSGGLLIRRSISDEILIPLISALTNEKINITKVNELIKKLPITLDEAINQLNDVCDKYVSQMNEKIKITCNSFIANLANSKIDSLYMDNLYNAVNCNKSCKDDMITYVRSLIDVKKHMRQYRVMLNHLFDDMLRISKIDVKENIDVIKKNLSIDVLPTAVMIQHALALTFAPAPAPAPALMEYAEKRINSPTNCISLSLVSCISSSPSSPIFTSKPTVNSMVKVTETARTRSRIDSTNSIEIMFPSAFDGMELLKGGQSSSPVQLKSRFPNKLDDHTKFYCTNEKITAKNGTTESEVTVIGPFDGKNDTVMKQIRTAINKKLGCNVSIINFINSKDEETYELAIYTGSEKIEKKAEKYSENHGFRMKPIYDKMQQMLKIIANITQIDEMQIHSPTLDMHSPRTSPVNRKTPIHRSNSVEEESDYESSDDDVEVTSKISMKKK